MLLGSDYTCLEGKGGEIEICIQNFICSSCWSQPILIEDSHHLHPPPVFLDVCFPKITEFEIIYITVSSFLTNSASLVFISSTPHVWSGLEVQ